MSAYAQALLLVKKRKISYLRQDMENRLKFMDELPQDLLQNLFVNREEFETYLARNDNYSKASFDIARQLIDDLQEGHKHNDIHT